MASPLTRTPTSGTQFLDPAVLGRIGNLQLLAKTVVDGFLTGLHRSPYLGFSIEFAEHRPYMPGDDIRRIDWRRFARSDRLVIKLCEADTNANFAVRRLRDMGPRVTFAENLADAAEKAVAAAKQKVEAVRRSWWERVMGAEQS